MAFTSGKRAFFFENYLSERKGDENYTRTVFLEKLGAVLISDHYYLPEDPPLRMKLLAFINESIDYEFIMDSVGKIYSFYGRHEPELLNMGDDMKDEECSICGKMIPYNEIYYCDYGVEKPQCNVMFHYDCGKYHKNVAWLCQKHYKSEYIFK